MTQHTRTYKYKTLQGAQKAVPRWIEYWQERAYTIYLCHVIQRTKIVNNITYDYAVVVVFFKE